MKIVVDSYILHTHKAVCNNISRDTVHVIAVILINFTVYSNYVYRVSRKGCTGLWGFVDIPVNTLYSIWDQYLVYSHIYLTLIMSFI